MSEGRKLGLRGLIQFQIDQIAELSEKIIKYAHNSKHQDEMLKLTEELLRESQLKYVDLVDNIDNIINSCPQECQCPVKKLKLK